MTSSRPAVWISKRDAISMVLAASRDGAQVSRSCARSTLRRLVLRGTVRAKPGARRAGNKYPDKLYRRADIERAVAARAPRTWLPSEDALLGTDHDHVVARKLRLAAHVVYARRRALGIVPHQSGGARCNPASWRWPAGHPRLERSFSPRG